MQTNICNIGTIGVTGHSFSIWSIRSLTCFIYDWVAFVGKSFTDIFNISIGCCYGLLFPWHAMLPFRFKVVPHAVGENRHHRRFWWELVDILNKECAIGIHILFDKHISLFKDIRLLYKSKKYNDRSWQTRSWTTKET